MRPRLPLGPVLAIALAIPVLLTACSGSATSGHHQALTSRSPAPSASTPSTTPAPTPTATPSTATTPATTPATTRSSRHRSAASTTAGATRRATSAPDLPDVHYPGGSGPLVVLNPGHNGGNATHPSEINKQVPAGFGDKKACDTTGTNTNAGYSEHAFNWSVTLDVEKVLQAHGVRVTLTRPNDTGVGPCVDRRAAIGNSAQVAAVVSIHADGAPSSGHGFHVNTASRRPDGASARTMQLNQDMAVCIHDALVHSSGLVPSTYIGSNGYYRRSDLAGLNLATRPATFLELGNMRNPHDAAEQSSTAGRQRIADAVAAGILTYLKEYA